MARAGPVDFPAASVLITTTKGGFVDREFVPQLPDHVSLAVRGFVNDAVVACLGRTPYDELELKVAATKLAAWARTHAGFPLENDVLFRREVIANFIATGAPEYRPAARGNLRSQLLRMSEILLPANAPRRLRPLPPSDPTTPYSEQEVALLRVWANTESTTARIANANVLLALGLGAGLSASEIGNVRVDDLLADDLGVVVRVTGERAREVPVLHAWESALLNRRQALSAGRFVFRENHGKFYPNLVSNFVARSHVIGPLPQTQRMRTTWIVHHLARGTPVKALLDAAGVESLEAFTRYVPFLPRLRSAEARVALQS
jgi:integrase